ncbi:hypothetical protein TOT_020000916 [Theileria orientalis strain Shintoku]|uniref:Uncharacterized protein n=1 Tax=Theileria orientalis strain Shintoku TaxID=869250 RepID=J4CD77_THEOR|nr:hypothetical protein TOT_020000916 [Theileria orientalis strain Shintoku]PVC49916.1 hypothetical protein MACL_00002678 [Theileria orientalis]BAM40662.1 hypothetical protein TOT_020000916 [Theileria orientalis strain Shintoku]|eukprot:XP_009690963.1 hypothetical protein TOT_020000916 [Theileria orientalis strain Shintoku]
MASIYLGKKSGSSVSSISSQVKATVNVTREIFKECPNFEKVTYKITYPTKYEDEYVPTVFGSYYNVLIYNGYNVKHRGTQIFGYYSPANNSQIVREVCVYYSVLRDNIPLMVTFVTRGNGTYTCTYETLISEKSFTACNINKKKLKQNLVQDLPKVHNKFTKRAKIKFKTEEGKNKYINGLNEIKLSRSFSKVIFISNKKSKKESSDEPYDFYNCELLKKNSLNDVIEKNVLAGVKDKVIDGIIVYYYRRNNIALLVEFINNCKSKTQIIRNYTYGNEWVNGNVTYYNNQELIMELEKIKNRMNISRNYNLGTAPETFNNSYLNESLGGNTTEELDEVYDDIEVTQVYPSYEDYYSETNTTSIGNIVFYILAGSILAAALVAVAYYKIPKLLTKNYMKYFAINCEFTLINKKKTKELIIINK